MIEVGIDMLPASLAAIVGQGRLLVGYQLDDQDRYVVQYVQPDGQRRELEYDRALGRCLTVDERRAELPPETREPLPDEGLTVVTRHLLVDELAERRVQFDAVDDGGATLVSLSKAVHVPLVWDGRQLIREALHRQRFPVDYAAWPRPQRVAYWATMLHRFRRASGESGHQEDEIYTPALIRDMEKTDPQVRQLLPDILAHLAALEHDSADQTIAAFTARTGVAVGAPDPGPGAARQDPREFDDLTVRPAAGPCDVAAIAAWLSAQSFAFLDPIESQVWHLSANSQTAARARQARLADRRRPPPGVLVSVLPDRVVLSMIANEHDRARAVEFLAWLAREGAWTVALDRSPPEPLGDPRRLVPPGAPEPHDLDHDELLVTPVASGRLLTWRDNVRSGRELVAHSSGAWRMYVGDGVHRGQLTEAAQRALAAALAIVDSDDPGMLDSEAAPATVAIEDADGLDFVAFDPGSPPPSCRALSVLVVSWLDALEAWQPGSVVDGLATVRRWIPPGRSQA